MSTTDADTRLDGALPLAGHWGVIRATGPDAAGFLQGQLTQDVQHLPPDGARLAGYCTAKGRLLSTFVVWRGGADEWLLACSADLLPATLKRLSMFVLRAKCRLVDASAEVALQGLLGPSAVAWLGARLPRRPWSSASVDGAAVIRLPDGDGATRLLLAAAAPLALPPLPALQAEAWDWSEVQSGVPRITAATSELFVPQMVNFELTGGVDFHKGCYPGQEVVARSQYRGTLKRRMHLFDVDQALAAGDEVFHDADPAQPAGNVVLAATRSPGRHAALVSLKTEALHGGTLTAGAGRAVLRLATLPYPVPAEAAA
jgi:folate-binding protein YgfZ